MKRKIKLMIGVTVMSLLAQASTNSLASAYMQISTYRADLSHPQIVHCSQSRTD